MCGAGFQYCSFKQGKLKQVINTCIPLVLEMQGFLKINEKPHRLQPVKYAAVIASPGYPDDSVSDAIAYLYQMPEGAYITYDIFIPQHQGFNNSQAVSLKVGASRNIEFDEKLTSRVSFKQSDSSRIQISMVPDSATRKNPVFLLSFAGK